MPWIEVGQQIRDNEIKDRDEWALIAHVPNPLHRKLFKKAREMEATLKRAVRVLSWIPESEETLKMRNASQADIDKAKAQQALITALLADIAKWSV